MKNSDSEVKVLMVFLVGYMYSGKSTTARLLADYLKDRFDGKVEWIDTDQAVEERYHLTIADCFRRYGEPMFRSLESAVLKQLVVDGQPSADANAIEQSNNRAITIVSTGGGTPCFNDNMQWMLDHGLTIYLRLDEEGIMKRIAVSRKPRPILADMSPEQRSERIHAQLQQRQPFYSKAHLTFDAANPDLETIAQAIIEHL
ncbi:MAG: hypothetical protein J5526_04340 [Bacteroidales bacterium]|nr:hypothetical protein [Bacteroidales bacterium]